MMFDCQALTLSVWLNLKRPSQSEACLLATSQRVNENVSWGFLVQHHRNGGLGVSFEYQSVNKSLHWSKQDIPVTLNKWFHLVVVWQQNSWADMKVYINKDPPIAVASVNLYDPQVLYSSSIRLGNITNGHDAALVDELQIWTYLMFESEFRKSFVDGEYNLLDLFFSRLIISRFYIPIC